MFDHHCSGIARVIEGCEEDEQSVVAVFPRAGAPVRYAERNDLRGAGLARDLHVLDRQAGAASSAGAIHHIAHRLTHVFDVFGGKIDGVEALRLCVQGQARHDMATSGEARGHHRQLQRAGEHIALANGGIDRVKGLPFTPPFLHFPCGIRHGSVELAGHRQRKLLPHSTPPRHCCNRVHAHALRHRVKIDITALINAPRHVDRTVTAPVPAAKHAIADTQAPAAMHLFMWVDALCHQRH